MKLKSFVILMLLSICLLAGSIVFALDSPKGEWWVTLKNGDKGKLAMQLSDPDAGNIGVSGYGYAYNNQTATFVSIPEGQTLQMDSAGHITGILELQDGSGLPDDPGLPIVPGLPIGSLEITGGSMNINNFKSFNLQGIVTLTESGSQAAVKLKGSRMPSSSTVYIGKTNKGKVAGKGMKSNTYVFEINNDVVLGSPFFTLSGNAPIKIDGAETLVALDGVLLRDPFSTGSGANIIGAFTSTSTEVGDGTVTGSLFVTKEGLRKANLKLINSAKRKLTLSGSLNIAVSPVISVTTNDSLNLGEVTVGKTEDLTFTITNIGVETLKGEVTIAGEGFHISTLDPTYSLGANEKKTITVVFKPLSAKSYSATVTFTGGGGATRTLTGTGKSAS